MKLTSLLCPAEISLLNLIAYLRALQRSKSESLRYMIPIFIALSLVVYQLRSLYNLV